MSLVGQQDDPAQGPNTVFKARATAFRKRTWWALMSWSTTSSPGVYPWNVFGAESQRQDENCHHGRPERPGTDLKKNGHAHACLGPRIGAG